jgi:poly [ADP-ribose] polymerase 2/3/4
LSNNTGLLLLCEVAAKPFYEQYGAVRGSAQRGDVLLTKFYSAIRCRHTLQIQTEDVFAISHSSADGELISFRATKGIGRSQPVKWKDAGKALNNEELVGCHMPDGPGQDVAVPGVYLQYNEVSSRL